MHKRKRQRLAFVGLGVVVIGIAAAIILTQLQEHLVFFHSPSELQQKPDLLSDRRLRIGGLVENGSVEKAGDGMVRFRITDLAQSLPVRYHGILPDLFREGQGVVVEGRMQEGLFVADQVLAKHDENYMPPEAAAALKASGQWQHMRETMENAGQHVSAPPGGRPQ
ncbi:MAG: cytochrome c maturation protein CcmE [Rhodospirillales bacterium]